MSSRIATIARHLRRADYLLVPWKNGLGWTTQIAIYPTDANYLRDRYLWRVSMAPVTASGRFSDFRGLMRTIVMLEGAGMVLNHGQGRVRRIDQLYDPYEFPGCWPTRCRLLRGPIEDFNVMTRRRLARARVRRFGLSRADEVYPLSANFHLFYTVRGPVRAMLRSSGETFDLRTGETLLLTGPEGRRTGRVRDKLALASEGIRSLLLGVEIFLR